MSNIEHLGFFVLPTELRLEVYGHLLTTALAEGVASDVAGLYMSCSTVQAEMQPMIANVRPILDIKNTWNTDSQTKSILRIELPSTYTYLNFPTDLKMDVPFTQDQYRWPYLALLLAPVFHLPIAVLRVGVYDATREGEIGIIRSLEVLRSVIQLRSGGHGEETLGLTDRLILQCGTRTDSRAEVQKDMAMVSMVLLAEEMLVKVKATWASRKDSRGHAMWELSFDFQDVSPAPEGYQFLCTCQNGLTVWSTAQDDLVTWSAGQIAR